MSDFPLVPILNAYGTPEQKQYIEGIIGRENHLAFALTEPGHGSDATWLETDSAAGGQLLDHQRSKALQQSGIPGERRSRVCADFGQRRRRGGNHSLHSANVDTRRGDTLQPLDFQHAQRSSRGGLQGRRCVPNSAILHAEGKGLVVAQRFVHENRIRQAAASIGAARYCIAEAVKYANSRTVFSATLSKQQAVQFQLAELHAECELVRNFIYSEQPGRWTARIRSRSATKCQSVISGQTAWYARRLIAPCRYMAAWAIRAPVPSSTYTDTIGAIASPKVLKRFKSGVWRNIYSNWARPNRECNCGCRTDRHRSP